MDGLDSGLEATIDAGVQQEGWSLMQSRRMAPAESSPGPTHEHRKNTFTSLPSTKDEAALKKLTDRSGGME